jgi:phosphotriesterase-related protein
MPPEQLGLTDAHNHLWIEPPPGVPPGAPVLNQMDLIRAELLDYRQAGGGAQIDCQPGGCGRDGRRLYQLSQETGVPIVACTGFHLQVYYPPEAALWQLNADQAAAAFLSEIRSGLEETRHAGRVVFPGFIKIAVHETLADTPQHLLEAAVVASRESGYAIEMHTQKGAGVEEFLAFFTLRNVAPQRLVFCHVDKRPDVGLHIELARAGVLLEYDTFFRPKYQPEQNVWPLIHAMASAGLANSLALATDLAEGALWQHIGGGPGLAAFTNVIKPRLEGMEFPPEEISGMMGHNIASRLAVSIKE